jgi:beta-lactamase superfamily II metal-dependent hydrolase
MHLTIFNVEHGACALLTCDNGSRFMIDCGHNATTGWMPGDYLHGLGLSKLDVLAITNYDEDHVSGLPNLLSRVNVGLYYRNPTVSAQTLRMLKSETGAGPGIAKLTSDVLRGWIPFTGLPPSFPGVRWWTFWNPYPHFDDENNLSMVVHLSINDTGFLFPGDLEVAGWENILDTNADFRAVVSQTHVLVASHHGRESGIYPDLFDKHGCKPSIVVISDDYHQYDTQKTTNYYNSKCIGIEGFRGQQKRSVLTTRNDGNIYFTFNQNGCVVQ